MTRYTATVVHTMSGILRKIGPVTVKVHGITDRPDVRLVSVRVHDSLVLHALAPESAEAIGYALIDAAREARSEEPK